MKTIDKDMVREAEKYVGELLEASLPDQIVFHNFNHAKYVAESAEYIGEGAGLNQWDINIALVSAWFHDTGFAVNPENHEIESVRIATEFLLSHEVDKKIVDQVERAILSTAMPQVPKDEISRVVCDADLRHLSADNYMDIIDKLREEWNNIYQENFKRKKFFKLSEKFFRMHHYHTDFAISNLDPGKKQNLELLKKEIFMIDKKKEEKILDKKKKKKQGYSRGVESMFRLTARNQISLSSIADNKSNILISVNAIMLSITMTVMVTRFDELPQLIIPTLVFLVFCLVTIVLAILSTRPNISKGRFSKEDIKNNKVNLLFFGNFYNMKLDEYEWAIGELMKNDENLYGTMIKDQYFLGKVLAKKYRLLRWAYSIFMFGIIISALTFVLAYMNI